jgi:hypothetical protein
VPDMGHADDFPILVDGVENAIGVGLASVEEMSRRGSVSRYYSARRLLFKAEDHRLQPKEPCVGGIGAFRLNVLVDLAEVADGPPG